MKKKKRTLMHILLLPLLLVVLFQGILPFSMLLSSGVKSIMESNAVDLDSYLVENSKVILENAGIETLWWMNCFRHLYITHHNSITQTPFHLFLH